MANFRVHRTGSRSRYGLDAMRIGCGKKLALEREIAMASQQKMRIVDEIGSREIYVNKVIDSTFDGAAIGVTLGCIRVVPQQLDTSVPPVVYVTGRLSLSQVAARELVDRLNGILAAISKGPGKAN